MGSPYAVAPARLPEVAECLFYHSIELPGLGLVEGTWDLRPGLPEYLGQTDFAGARVLEVGTADGGVCFELERRGAEVVAVDLPADRIYDAWPLPEAELHEDVYVEGLRRVRNAYWLSHHLLGSRARFAYAHANRLPDELGRFDVAVVANVLQHLRDPIGALIEAARVADTVVVTEADWVSDRWNDVTAALLIEDPNPFVWFQLKPRLVVAVLDKIGFDQVEVTRHTQLLLKTADHSPEVGVVPRRADAVVPHFTVTARRAATTA